MQRPHTPEVSGADVAGSSFKPTNVTVKTLLAGGLPGELGDLCGRWTGPVQDLLTVGAAQSLEGPPAIGGRKTWHFN